MVNEIFLSLRRAGQAETMCLKISLENTLNIVHCFSSLSVAGVAHSLAAVNAATEDGLSTDTHHMDATFNSGRIVLASLSSLC